MKRNHTAKDVHTEKFVRPSTMKISLFIRSNGIIARKDSTLQYINEEMKKTIPIAQISDIHCLGKVSVRSGAIGLLAEHHIPIHFYNMYETHISSLLPKKQYHSGKVLIEQVKAYLDEEKRLSIAAQIVHVTKLNMIYTLRRYTDRNESIETIINELSSLDKPEGSINQILGMEANIWKKYYSTFDMISGNLEFQKRSYRPPLNEFNALLSLTNMLLYTVVLSQIQQTYLSPEISYLHEPTAKRFSLSLDLAEYYKPLITHPLIFKLINTKQIKTNSFSQGYRLKPKPFNLVLTEFQESLNSVIGHNNKKLSYRTIIKHDCHRLLKTILENKPFKAFYRS